MEGRAGKDRVWHARKDSGGAGLGAGWTGGGRAGQDCLGQGRVQGLRGGYWVGQSKGVIAGSSRAAGRARQ